MITQNKSITSYPHWIIQSNLIEIGKGSQDSADLLLCTHVVSATQSLTALFGVLKDVIVSGTPSAITCHLNTQHCYVQVSIMNTIWLTYKGDCSWFMQIVMLTVV